MNEANRALLSKFGDSVRFDMDSRHRASMDNARLSFMPDAVVLPEKSADIGSILRLANQYKVAVTVRGAGSATTGATSPVKGGWVVDVSALKSVSLDTVLGIASSEVGVTLSELNQTVGHAGWFYPPDPSSKKFATVGGSIATNAGGLRGAKYGVTRDYVLGLEGYLPTGQFVKWGAPLKKFASGYNIRDLWIGSEGTLGVVTRAHLKLIPKPEERWTCLAVFHDEKKAIDAVLHLLHLRLMPAILEFLDPLTVECAAHSLGNSEFSDLKGATLLLIEVDGSAQTVAESKAAVLRWVQTFATQHREALSEEDAEQLWEVRRACSEAMFQLGDSKINEDVVVPAHAYQEFIDFKNTLQKTIELPMPTFGHLADGNFHVHIMYDRARKTHLEKAEQGVQRLMEKVVSLGGAITGEHGIGLAKSSFLHLQHSTTEIDVMKAVKAVFDPNAILNPGKLFEPTPVWTIAPDTSVRFPWQKN